MTKRIFITATNTDIGKTYSTLQLLDAFAAMGYRVGVYKPIETGVNGLPADGSLLLKTAQNLNPELKTLRISDIVPLSFILPAAPYVANKGAKIDCSQFDRPLEKIEKYCDIVLIEGSGGIMTPIDNDLMMIHLAQYFNATALLITHCHLGCINDTLLSLNALKQFNIPYELGFNCREEDKNFRQISFPYFKNHFNSLYFIGHNIRALAQALLDKTNVNDKEAPCTI